MIGEKRDSSWTSSKFRDLVNSIIVNFGLVVVIIAPRENDHVKRQYLYRFK